MCCMRAEDGYQWSDYNCSVGAAFLCQYDCKRDPFWCVRGTVVLTEDTCICECESGWTGPLCDEVDDFVAPLYEIGTSEQQFTGAELFCAEMRTTLPSVSTVNTWNALKEFVGSRSFLSDKFIYVDLRLVDGEWVDSAGNSPEEYNWLDGEPKQDAYDGCAVISPADDYRLISVDCSENFKYICELPCTKGYEKWCIHGDIVLKKSGACSCVCWPGSFGGRCEEYDYDDVINKTLLFYMTQRSGQLPETDDYVPWRQDSALMDEGYNQEDLTAGWYDAGDHIKVTFKHTASVWKLAWAFLEFRDAYEEAGLVDFFYDTLKWGNDYTMKLHTKPHEFYAHVGNPSVEHSYWTRPEDMVHHRQTYPTNETHPATEVAANGASSLAASYLVFRDVDTQYADELLRHARELYDFADQFRGTIEDNVPELHFKSGDYEDELTNAALWMYLATNETHYFDTARSYYDQYAMSKKSPLFTRNRVQNALQLMMYITTNDSPYLDSFEDGLARWGPDWIVYTRKGLAMYTWNRPMKRAADISFLALVAAKHGIKSEENFNFARSQIHYMLGDGGRSYLTSFGRYPPLRPHHRANSCPLESVSCGSAERDSPYPSPNVLYGGLVGGPDERDCYFDHRRNWEQNEAGVNVATFQGAVAGLSHFRIGASASP
ncbi:uncharacterized protein [Ptychodera flava]|uniref:uncharacterized protein n=1 Tax=Ptychodera flava TaxID=63121 RepID=UPI003969CD1F